MVPESRVKGNVGGEDVRKGAIIHRVLAGEWC